MKYLVAIICPPLAVLMCGRPMQALVNLALTLCLWVPGIIHALFIVNRAMADEKAGSTLHVMQLNSVLHKDVTLQRCSGIVAGAAGKDHHEAASMLERRRGEVSGFDSLENVRVLRQYPV